MSSLCKVVVCSVCLAVLAAAPMASAQAKLEGAWKLSQWTTAGPGPNYKNPQPGFIIFTKNHYSIMLISGDKPRPELPDNPTIDPMTTPFSKVWANAGTYEIKDRLLITHPLASNIPRQPEYFAAFLIAFEGPTLSLTQLADGDGPMSHPMILKFVRAK